MSKTDITIFISSRFDEFKDLRKVIAEKKFGSLVEIGITIKMLDYRGSIADYRSPSQASIDEAENSDIFIFLLGETYGEVPENFDKSYIHLEYETAISKGMKVLAFPVGSCYDPENETLSEKDSFRQLQESILKNNIHTTAPYTSSDYCVEELYLNIHNTLTEVVNNIVKRQLLHKEDMCPYNVKYLHENENSILQRMFEKVDENTKDILKQKLLTEKYGDSNMLFPTLVLQDNEVYLSDSFSNEKDTNKINENFIVELKERCGKTIWNNPTFRLMQIKENKITLGLSDYFKTLSTCDIHYYNFMRQNQSTIENSAIYKEWMTQLKNIVVDNNFSGISASLGCSTLLVVRNYINNKFQYYVVNNSTTKNGNNTKHVVPSFMFAPTKMVNNDLKLQSDIIFQVLKEFAEELLGMEELEKINDYQKLYYMLDNSDVISMLKELLTTGEATFKVLGLSLDLFRLRPELLTVLVVDNREFDRLLALNRKLSWEASTEDMEGLHIVDIDDEQTYLDLMFNDETPLVSPASACLKLGREYVLKNFNL